MSRVRHWRTRPKTHAAAHMTPGHAARPGLSALAKGQGDAEDLVGGGEDADQVSVTVEDVGRVEAVGGAGLEGGETVVGAVLGRLADVAVGRRARVDARVRVDAEVSGRREGVGVGRGPQRDAVIGGDDAQQRLLGIRAGRLLQLPQYANRVGVQETRKAAARTTTMEEAGTALLRDPS